MTRKKLQRNKRGFTLIEIMVAVSIFVIVAFMVSSTLLVVIDANRRASMWRSIMDNVNFAVDSMSFKMKFGSRYSVSAAGPDNTDQVDFFDRDQRHIVYCQDTVSATSPGDRPYQAIFACDHGASASTACGLGVPDCRPITSSDIDVIKLRMREGVCRSDLCPAESGSPRLITILVEAKVKLKDQYTSLDFQTSVAQSQSQ
jgi:prepilin-type N-terminal cleavage/methylation domain-containing protein